MIPFGKYNMLPREYQNMYVQMPRKIQRLLKLGCAGKHWAWYFVGKYLLSIGQTYAAFEYAFKRGSHEGDHNCCLLMAAQGYLGYGVYHDLSIARAIFADVIATGRPIHRDCQPDLERLCKAFPDVDVDTSEVRFYPSLPTSIK
jgi:hypothetical protein